MSAPASTEPAPTASPALPATIRYGLTPLAEAAAMDGLAFLRAMLAGHLPAPPVCEVAAIRMVSADPGHVVFEGDPDARFYNPLGTIHGGWTSTLMDTVMACAVHSVLKAGQAYTTAEFKVHFVRPVLPATGVIRAEGRIVHAGGRIATSEGRMTDARGKLLAHGTETCFVFDAPGSGAR